MRKLKAITLFYCSAHHGSEYKSGYQFLRYAADHEFDVAFISDLPFNYSRPFIQHTRIIVIPQTARSQSCLYEKDDFSYVLRWIQSLHVYISSNRLSFSLLWICNPAQPWLPIVRFLPFTQRLIWGPIGGGESLPFRTIARYPTFLLKETLRSILQILYLKTLSLSLSSNQSHKLTILARTPASSIQLSAFQLVSTLLPEILTPTETSLLIKVPAFIPTFIWIGRAVPRKNLLGAIAAFKSHLSVVFPDSRLLIYGVSYHKSLPADPRISYKGWCNSIPYEELSSTSVLLFSSLREGMPSVVIDSLRTGILVVSNNVGSVSLLQPQSLLYLVHASYFDPRARRSHVEETSITEAIKAHLASTSIQIKQRDFTSIADSIINPLLPKPPSGS